MATQPGWSAVPGSAWPGAVWPGHAGHLVVPAVGVTFSLGIPSFAWAAGSAAQDWETGVPYGV
jgi:hypothetical protein